MEHTADLAAAVDAVLDDESLTGTRWSVELRPVAGADAAYGREPDLLLPTASVGKVLLLVEVAAALADGSLDPDALLDRRAVEPVGDSGLWQHLRVEELPAVDAARLVGAVSDNLATNVLLDAVGLDRVRRRASDLCPGGSALHDRVRDDRGPGDPPTLSEGCAADWASLMARLRRGEVVSPGVSATVLGWLADGVDLSLVAGGLDLDPLAHAPAPGGPALWHKTGADPGVRADVGVLAAGGAETAYAVLCAWPPERADLLPAVLATMRRLGALLASSRSDDGFEARRAGHLSNGSVDPDI